MGVRRSPGSQRMSWDWEGEAWRWEKEGVEQKGALGKGKWGSGGGAVERARRRQPAVVLSPWVPFNSVNVPGWRQEGSSIIKLIEMRGWVRN